MASDWPCTFLQPGCFCLAILYRFNLTTHDALFCRWDIAQWESIVCAAHHALSKYAVEKEGMQRLLAKCHHLVGHLGILL